MNLKGAAKCVLISFISTMRSNVSVGPPIGLMIHNRDTQKPGLIVRLEADDPYLRAIRETWGAAIHKAFDEIGHVSDWRV